MENSTYARISQEEGGSGALSSTVSPSSSHQESFFQPLSADVDMETDMPPHQRSSVSSMMHALNLGSGPSYGRLDSSESERNARYPQESISPAENEGSPLRRWNTQESTGQQSIVSHTSIPLRHPTPDLQALQGAYVRNVEHLEQTAEKLSMTSDMGEELRKMHLELKRSESRRSSVMTSPALQKFEAQAFPSQIQGGSVSNSIVETNSIARSGGFSPGGYVTSPRGSMRSGSRVRSISRPGQGGKLPESPSVPIIAPPKPPPHVQHAVEIPNSPEQGVGPLSAEAVPLDISERPATADTYQQTSTLFTDFDGIHFAQEHALPVVNESSSHRLSHPARPVSYAPALPTSEKNMVYYPAPVPMMLNLPQKLSKMPPSAVRDKRRSQVIDSLQPAARDSAAWLPGDDGLGQFREDQFGAKRNTVNLTTNPNRRSNAYGLSQLPPQLRASAFFDQPAVRQEIEIKDESAVATLESILDASANAPVNAFTDHFIVGHVGAEVYGRSAARRSTSNIDLLGGKKPNSSRRQSSMNLLRRRASGNLDLASQRRSTGEIAKVGQNEDRNTTRNSHISLSIPNGFADGTGETVDQDGTNELEEAELREEASDEASDEGEHEYHGPPTTLLAELQLRKQQQKLRTRTAATAFPNGMYSTLLQLDAVAEVQKNSRKQKHITLAWEDTYAHGDASDQDDDEDVPLGVLFPGRDGLVNRQDRPMGLMQQRDMEDNEPLSRRRTRLLGEAKRASTMFQLEVPHLEGQASGESGDEDETLAERIKRLKAKGGTTTGMGAARPISHQFAAELTSQFGLSEYEKRTSQIDINKSAEPEEETLGQRRRRLQAERDALNQNGATPQQQQQQQKTHSLANLLQAHPVRRASTLQLNNRPTDISAGYIASAGTNTGLHQPVYRGALASNGAMMQALSNTMAYNNIRMGNNAYGQGPTANMYASRSMMQLGQPPPPPPLPGDSRQRDMVERWRQGVSQ